MCRKAFGKCMEEDSGWIAFKLGISGGRLHFTNEFSAIIVIFLMSLRLH